MPKKFTIISTLTVLCLSTLGVLAPSVFAEATAIYTATDVSNLHAEIMANIAETCGTDTTDDSYRACRSAIFRQAEADNPGVYAAMRTINLGTSRGFTLSAYNPYAHTIRFYVGADIATYFSPYQLKNLVIFWADNSYAYSNDLNSTRTAMQSAQAWQIANAMFNGEEAPQGVHIMYNSNPDADDWFTVGVEQRIVIDDESDVFKEGVPKTIFMMGKDTSGNEHYHFQIFSNNDPCGITSADQECRVIFLYDENKQDTGFGITTSSTIRATQATAEDLALIERQSIIKEAEEKALAAQAAAEAAEERAIAAEARAEAAEAAAAAAQETAQTAATNAQTAKSNASSAQRNASLAKSAADAATANAQAAEAAAREAEATAATSVAAAREAEESAKAAEVAALAAEERASQIAAEATHIAEEAQKSADEAERVAAETAQIAEDVRKEAIEARQVADEAKNLALELAQLVTEVNNTAKEASDAAKEANGIAKEAKETAENSLQATTDLMETIDGLNGQIATLTKELDDRIAAIGVTTAEIQALIASNSAGSSIPAPVTNNYVTYSTTEIIKNEYSTIAATNTAVETREENGNATAVTPQEAPADASDYVEVPLAATNTEEKQFPWWIIVFAFSGIALMLWWFIPLKKRSR